MILINRKRKSN